MALAAAAMMAAPMIANMIGGKKSKGPDYGPAIQAIQNVAEPNIEDMKVQLQELVATGQISPEQADALLQEQSAMADMEIDPLTRQAQLQALGQLQDVGAEGGLDDIAGAKVAQAQQEFRTTEKGAREAAMQRAQEQGLGSSEISIANQLLAGQNAATTGAMQSQQAAADANSRALEAIYSSGQLGGQIRGQDFGQGARRAEAQDEIARFNVMSRQQAQQQNVARREQANYANLAERQRLGDYNASMENQNRLRNADLAQRQFDNQMQKANAMASLYGAQAQGQSQARQQDQNMMGQMIGIGGQLGSAYMGYQNQNQGSEKENGGGSSSSKGRQSSSPRSANLFDSAGNTQSARIAPNDYWKRNTKGFQSQVMPRRNG